MIWLIGCHGMLGTEVSRRLKEKKIDFVATGHEVDITDFSALSDFAMNIIGKNIDFIINCAAYTNVDKAESESNLAQRINEDGPANIARLANQIHAILIHISTDYVFDGTDNLPFTENNRIVPIGVYGKTKAAGEIAVQKQLEEYYIIRTAWLYGHAGKNFVYTMLRLMNGRDSIKVVDDQKGSPTFAADLAEVIIKIIEQASSNSPLPYGIYHCTDSGEATWYDFACEIKKQGIELGLIDNKNCIINPCATEEYPTPAKRPAYSVLDKEKIQKTLGITIPAWQESLRKFLESPLFDKSRIEQYNKAMTESEIRNGYSKLTKSLIGKKLTITTMESATAGLIASLITDTEGSSAVLKGAFVTYCNQAKIMQGVPADIIEKYSVYSKETASAMASACAKTYEADIGIGVTGTFGNPDPANPKSSVPGKVYFAILFNGEMYTYCYELLPLPSRFDYKMAVAEKVLQSLNNLFL